MGGLDDRRVGVVFGCLSSSSLIEAWRFNRKNRSGQGQRPGKVPFDPPERYASLRQHYVMSRNFVFCLSSLWGSWFPGVVGHIVTRMASTYQKMDLVMVQNWLLMTAMLHSFTW